MGTWEADKLSARDEVTVTFSDTSKYEGMFKDWCFSGPGKYIYPDGSILHADFSENCPVGQLTLIDPNGHAWLGNAQQGYCWFEPVNHFYEMLDKTSDVGRSKRRRKQKNSTQTNQN